jgi:hypothetical protein
MLSPEKTEEKINVSHDNHKFGRGLNLVLLQCSVSVDIRIPLTNSVISKAAPLLSNTYKAYHVISETLYQRELTNKR